MWKSEKPVHVLLHLAIISGVTLVVMFIFFNIYLPVTTNHNEKILVPALKGKSLAEAEEQLKKAGLRYHINDSAYVEGKPGQIILSQHPEAISEVKANRKIYLSVTSSQPPKVKMPKLEGQSLRTAELTLKSMDLRKGTITYIDYPYKDLVIGQNIDDTGIAPGSYIAKGSRINLVVGNGIAKTGSEDSVTADTADTSGAL